MVVEIVERKDEAVSAALSKETPPADQTVADVKAEASEGLQDAAHHFQTDDAVQYGPHDDADTDTVVAKSYATAASLITGDPQASVKVESDHATLHTESGDGEPTDASHGLDSQLSPETPEGVSSKVGDDDDFVPPDMEHIVSTGAAQDSAASMQALRELVAQARSSSGQPRDALPPAFEAEEFDAPAAEPTPAQRGEKRKAEAEFDDLVQASAGIEEVKAAAEKSQHPETKTLLQKALSSISGLVSRRRKVDPSLSTSTETGPTHATSGDNSSDSDIDSSSESNSSDSESSDDEEDEDAQAGGQDAAHALAADDDDDEEGGGPSGSTAPATKNEILAPDVEQPPVQEVAEAEKATLRKLGKVHSVVDSVVVIEQDVQQAKPSDASDAANVIPVDSTGRQGERDGEYSVLDTGSLLCFEGGKVLGLVFETFGSIHNPMYSIRFPSAAAIDRSVIKTGRAVYYLPAQSTYVLTQLLRSMKGSDASNMWDEEVAEDEIDYSDDEQEAEAKRRAKAIRAGKVDDQGNPLPSASNRGNKRQKQASAGGPSHTANHQSPANYSRQGFGHTGSSSSNSKMDSHDGPHMLPRRNAGPSQPPHPLTPAVPASLGPAFPHGIASLPPKPSAGLPSKPSFAVEPTSSFSRQGSATSGNEPSFSSRSRMGTADGTSVALNHNRMSSGAAAANLPAKPVDAVAAAAASSGPGSPTNHRPQGSVGGLGSPAQPLRLAAMGHGAQMPASTNTYPHHASPAWYPGSGSATPNAPASPAMQSPHTAGRSAAYSPAAGAPPTIPSGHYNPAYAAYWQHGFGPTPSSAGPTHASANMSWNASHAYTAPPLHLGQGAVNPHVYPTYGSYGHYGAEQADPWSGGSYPGSHYPGYGDGAAQSQHAPAAQPHGTTAYYSQAGNADAYPAYGYGAAAQHAPGAAGQDGYDPRSPSMASSGKAGATQSGPGQQVQ